jgi:hypothetical protein
VQVFFNYATQKSEAIPADYRQMLQEHAATAAV